MLGRFSKKRKESKRDQSWCCVSRWIPSTTNALSLAQVVVGNHFVALLRDSPCSKPWWGKGTFGHLLRKLKDSYPLRHGPSTCRVLQNCSTACASYCGVPAPERNHCPGARVQSIVSDRRCSYRETSRARQKLQCKDQQTVLSRNGLRGASFRPGRATIRRASVGGSLSRDAV